ncbi:MAG: hypothetical protein V2B18_03215 [Pseudomonadota bacterium]
MAQKSDKNGRNSDREQADRIQPETGKKVIDYAPAKVDTHVDSIIDWVFMGTIVLSGGIVFFMALR